MGEKAGNRQYVGHFIHCLLACKSFRKALLQEDSQRRKYLIESMKTVCSNGQLRTSFDADRLIKILESHYKAAFDVKDWTRCTEKLLDILCEEGWRHLCPLLTGRKSPFVKTYQCTRGAQIVSDDFRHLTLDAHPEDFLLSSIMGRHYNKQKDGQYCKSCFHDFTIIPEEIEIMPEILILVLVHPSSKTSELQMRPPDLSNTYSGNPTYANHSAMHSHSGSTYDAKRYSSTADVHGTVIHIEEQLDFEAMLPLSARCSKTGRMYRLRGVIYQGSLGWSALVKSDNEAKLLASWEYWTSSGCQTLRLESFENYILKSDKKPSVFFYSRDEEFPKQREVKTTEVRMKASGDLRTTTRYDGHDELSLARKPLRSGSLRTQNTSCVNSVLQGLFTCTRFKSAVLGLQTSNENYKGTLTLALKQAFKILEARKDAFGFADGLLDFMESHEAFYQFTPDSSNFLRTLLHALSQERLLTLKTPFHGKLAKYITCLKCKRQHDSAEAFSDLILNVPKQYHSISVSSLLKEHFDQLELKKSNRYDCSKCRRHTDAVLNLAVAKSPEYLVLSLSCFRMPKYGALEEKIETPIKCDEEIDITPFSGQTMNNQKYKLKAAILHNGSFASTGSCTCYVAPTIHDNTRRVSAHRTVQTLYRFTDDIEMTVAEMERTRETPVLLIYEKKRPPNEQINTNESNPGESTLEADARSTVPHERSTVPYSGNNSFIDCAVQALYMCTQFRKELLKKTASEKVHRVNIALQEAFSSYDRDKHSDVSPVLQFLTEADDANGYHKDCSEFLRSLLSHLSNERSSIMELLTGSLKREFLCSNCQTSKYNNEEFTHLILPVPNNTSHIPVSELLNNYFKTSMLEGDNQYLCGRCKKPQNGEVKMNLTVIPQYLLLSISCFQYQESTFSTNNTKILSDITCDPSIDMTPYLSPILRDKEKYRLLTAVVHCGYISHIEKYKCYQFKESITTSEHSWQEADREKWVQFGKNFKDSGQTRFWTGESPVILIYERSHNKVNGQLQREGPEPVSRAHRSGSPEDAVQLTNHDLDVTSTRYKTGLSNLGNTCYMNSVIQALFMCQGFQGAVLRYLVSSEQKIAAELQRVFLRLKECQEWSFSPAEFLEVSKPKWFSYGDQHDSSEYLRHLLDKLSQNGMAKATDLFTGQLKRQVACKNCDKRKVGGPENFTDLMLHCPSDKVKTYSAHELLDNYLKDSTLPDDEEYFCEKCSKPSQALLTLELMEVPEYLTLTILRFELEHLVRPITGKIMTEVTCDEELDIPVGKERVKYSLNAVIVHCGYFATSGHYKCYARSAMVGSLTRKSAPKGDEASSSKWSSSNMDPGWYCFDDSIVTPVSNPKFHDYDSTPVVLIYHKTSEEMKARDEKNDKSSVCVVC